MKRFLLTVLLLLALVGVSCATDLTWERVTASANWSGRTEHATCIFDGKFWVIGGKNTTGYQHDVWYSPVTDGVTWTCANYAAAFPARGGHAVLPQGGFMYLIGGTNDTWTQTCNLTGNPVITHTSFYDVWKSSDGATWTLVTNTPAWKGTLGNISWGLSYFGSTVGDSQLWITGGRTFESDYDPASATFPSPYDYNWQASNYTWRSYDGSSWANAGSLPNYTDEYDPSFSPVTTGWLYHQSPWTGQISVIGGEYTTQKSFEGVYFYDIGYPAYGTAFSSFTGATWNRESVTAPWVSRYLPSVVYVDSKLVLMGGYGSDSTYKKDAWYSENLGETWTQYSDADWAVRECPQAQVTTSDNKIWVFGGYNTDSGFLSDVWRGEINTSAATPGGSSGAGIMYPPHNVQIIAKDRAGNPLSDVTVTAEPVATTLGSWDWLNKLLGIPTADVNIAGTTLTGTTGDDGAVAFMMIETVRYNITFVDSTRGISDSYFIFPKNDAYLFTLATNELPASTPSMGKYITYSLEPVYTNDTYVTFAFSWVDSASVPYTHYILWSVTDTDGTVLDTHNLTLSGGVTNASYSTTLGNNDEVYHYGFRANLTTFGWFNQSGTVQSHKQVTLGIPEYFQPFVGFGLMALVGLMFSRRSWKHGVFMTTVFGFVMAQLGLVEIGGSKATTFGILMVFMVLSVATLLRSGADSNG